MYKVGIVEDDKITVEIIDTLLSQNFSNIVRTFNTNTVSGTIKALKQEKPDFLIMDINLLDGSVFEIFEKVDVEFIEIVFITSSSDHAIEAFKINALDYILKPITKSNFILAINKALKKIELNKLDQNLISKIKKIKIKQNNSYVIVNLSEILFVEADGSNTQITLADKVIFSNQSMSEFENEFKNEENFSRVHHSYIVNHIHITNYLKSRGGTLIMKNGFEIPISQRKLKDFDTKFKK